jgi:hypothetical protein
MTEDHLATERDRLIVARLDGVLWRHARWHEPTQQETDAAVAELREVAGGRLELLAEAAGILLGFHDGGLDEPRAKAAAAFCVAAGADESLIPQWAQEGRRRAEMRRKPPFSGPARRAPRRP